MFKAPAANDAQSALVARPERGERKESGPMADDAQRRLIELRAQSRGLWSDSSDKIPAVTQPRVEKLPKAVLGVTSLTPANAPRAPSMPPMAASVRPEISIDSDAPTAPPSEVHDVQVSDRPTDVRKSLRALSARPSRPSEEPTPEVDRRPTPVVAQPDEPLLAQTTPSEGAPSQPKPAASAELSPSVLEQAAKHGALEAAHRSSMQRAAAVLVGCVVLLGLGLVFGWWPTPWSTKPEAAPAPVAKAPPPLQPQAAPQQAAPQQAAPQQAAPQQEAPQQAAPAQAPTAQPQPEAAQPQAQPSAAPAQPPAAQPQPAAAAPQAPPTAAAAQPHPTVAPDEPAPGAQSGPTGTLDVGNSLRLVRGHLRNKDPIAAEALLRPLMDQNPDDHHIAELLVQALIDQKRGGEAATIAQRIIKKRPKRAVYRVLLGDALRVAGQITAANAAWKEALELEPDNKEALKRLNAP